MPVVLRELAQRDVEEALAYYATEAGEQVALAWVDDFEKAIDHLARHPGTGATRYAHELDLHGLRAWRLRRYPYLVFYLERADHIDVWRVLHAQRDMATWLHAPE